MNRYLIIPLHENSSDLAISMSRKIGPDKIVLCHRWKKSGEAHSNAIRLRDFFEEKLLDLGRLEKSSKKRGNILPRTEVEVKALEYYYSMEGLATVYFNFIGELSKDEDVEIHMLILDEMPMGYIIGAFYAGLTSKLTVWTGDVGRDIRSKHPSKYNPGDSMTHTLRKISLLKEINDGLKWIRKAESSAITLRLAKDILDNPDNDWFTTAQIVNNHHLGYGQTAIVNHINRLIKEGFAERIEGGKTKYKLTELGLSIAELTDEVNAEEG